MLVKGDRPSDACPESRPVHGLAVEATLPSVSGAVNNVHSRSRRLIYVVIITARALKLISRTGRESPTVSYVVRDRSWHFISSS